MEVIHYWHLLIWSSYVVIWLQKVILKEKGIEDVFGCVWGARGLVWVNRMGLWTQFDGWRGRWILKRRLDLSCLVLGGNYSRGHRQMLYRPGSNFDRWEMRCLPCLWIWLHVILLYCMLFSFRAIVWFGLNRCGCVKAGPQLPYLPPTYVSISTQYHMNL